MRLLMQNAFENHHISRNLSFFSTIKGYLNGLILLVIIPILLTNVYFFYNRFQHQQEDALNANIEMARTVGHSVEMYIHDVAIQELAIGISLVMRNDLTPRQINLILKKNREESPDIRDFTWTDPMGRVLASSQPGMVGEDLSLRPEIQEILKSGKKWTISSLYRAKTTEEAVFNISRAIRDNDGSVLGIVTASIDTTGMGGHFAFKRSSKDSILNIIDDKGMLVYRFPAVTVSWKNRDWVRNDPEFYRSVLSGKEGMKTIRSTVRNDLKIAAATPMSSVGWAATAGRMRQDVLGPIYRDLLKSSAILLFIAIFSFFIALNRSRKISDGIDSLQKLALSIGRGEYKHKISISGPRELHELGLMFNRMADEIVSRESARNAELDAREKAEQELAANEALLRTLMDRVPIPIQAYDLDGTVTYWNRASEQVYGYTAEAAQGRNLADLIFPPQQKGQFQDILKAGRELTESGEFLPAGEQELVNKAGDPVWVYTSHTAVCRPGRQTILFCLAINLTDRKKTEEALRKSEEHLRLALSIAKLGVFEWDIPTQKIVFGNDRAFEISGRTKQNGPVSSADYTSIIVPEDRPAFEQTVRDAMQTTGTAHLVYRILRVDDHRERWVEIFGRFDFAPDKTPRRLVGVIADITEKKQMEAELLQYRDELEAEVKQRTSALVLSNEQLDRQKEVLQTIFDNIPVMLYLFDTSGNMQFASRAMEQTLGWSLAEMKSEGPRIMSKFYPDPEYRKIIWQNIEKAVEGWKDYTMTTRSGIRLETSWAMTLLSDGSIIFIGIDITDRKASEKQLRNYTQRLIHSNQALQDFAFIASHDLQEPLRKVITFGRLLQQKYTPLLNGEGLDYLDRLLNATERMKDLLRSLLDYSRVTIKAEPFKSVDLSEIVREVLSDLEVQVHKTNGEVDVGDLPIVSADPSQMRQLFQNLIGNALKFHRPGKSPLIRIRSHFTDNGIRIDVEDNGIGFEEAYLNKIFTAFGRIHSREYEGTGMGLAICKKIVDRHGGTITAKSTPGKGSIFSVYLPLGKIDEVELTF